MRATTLLVRLLGVKQTRVCGVTVTPTGVVADVAPTTRVPRCSGCGCRVRRIYDRRRRRWRHLDLAGVRLVLRYALRRAVCPRCGVRAELVPWAAHGVWFTTAFEDAVAYLAQRTDRTTVATLARTTWRSVTAIVGRVVARHHPADRLDGLTLIGIDELAYRRGQRGYLTIVVDHVRRRVVWAARGRDRATVQRFFTALGPARTACLRAVTLDLSNFYRDAVAHAAPHVQLIFDRFHVQRLAHEALDTVRRTLVRTCRDRRTARWLKATRWALRKRPWDLTATEATTLGEVERRNRPLYRAYLLKEDLADVFDSPDLVTARRRFARWLRWATRSRLAPFAKLARTLRPLREGILAYVAWGLTSALSEGLNLKIRAITRRGYGIPDPDSLATMIFLCCGGIVLPPPHVTPRFH